MASRVAALKAVRTILEYIGEDPSRPGLIETPERFIRAWESTWGAGYREPSASIVKLFPGEALYNEMVLVRGINFSSHCEHHLAPFFGTADIGYLPGAAGVLGLSKLARIVEHFARRLQVQERLTDQIADFLEARVSDLGSGVVLRATHLCMVSRGVQQRDAKTVTSALRGAMYNNATTRAEFLALTKD